MKKSKLTKPNKKPGRKSIEDNLKLNKPIYVSIKTKESLDVFFDSKRKNYDSIIQYLLHARATLVGVSASVEKAKQPREQSANGSEQPKK